MPARKAPTSKPEAANPDAHGVMLIPEKLAPLVHASRLANPIRKLSNYAMSTEIEDIMLL